MEVVQRRRPLMRFGVGEFQWELPELDGVGWGGVILEVEAVRCEELLAGLLHGEGVGISRWRRWFGHTQRMRRLVE